MQFAGGDFCRFFLQYGDVAAVAVHHDAFLRRCRADGGQNQRVALFVEGDVGFVLREPVFLMLEIRALRGEGFEFFLTQARVGRIERVEFLFHLVERFFRRYQHDVLQRVVRIIELENDNRTVRVGH